MGAVVATAWLIKCMQIMSEPDSMGVVYCCGFGELGNEPEYDAKIATDPYGDFSMGRWLWVFQDLRRVEPVSIDERQGVWTLPAALLAEFMRQQRVSPHVREVKSGRKSPSLVRSIQLRPTKAMATLHWHPCIPRPSFLSVQCVGALQWKSWGSATWLPIYQNSGASSWPKQPRPRRKSP